jgi:hypothetical protein
VALLPSPKSHSTLASGSLLVAAKPIGVPASGAAGVKVKSPVSVVASAARGAESITNAAMPMDNMCLVDRRVRPPGAGGA